MRIAYSGGSYNRGFYNALFNVLNTTLVSAGFLLHDQDIAFDQDKYVHDAEAVESRDDNASHFDNLIPGNRQSQNQTCSSKMQLFRKKFHQYTENIFDRKKKLSMKGVAMNSDGSTNNMASYIHYSRTVISKSVIFYYVISLAWAYFCGFFCYTV